MAGAGEPAIFLIDGKILGGDPPVVRDGKLGLLASDLKEYGQRGQFTAIAQFYKLVRDGLILSRHIFRGLQRPLFCDDNSEGDQQKLVYSRRPACDYEWAGGRVGAPARRDAPPGRVFVVIVSPNIRHRGSYPQVDGWVERWNWVDEDTGLPEAPIDWVDRYEQKVWTRE